MVAPAWRAVKLRATITSLKFDVLSVPGEFVALTGAKFEYRSTIWKGKLLFVAT
jgi:hypothetical protein